MEGIFAASDFAAGLAGGAAAAAAAVPSPALWKALTAVEPSPWAPACFWKPVHQVQRKRARQFVGMRNVARPGCIS